MCQRPEAFATACAVSRAFPSYNRKSGATSQHNVIVTCLFVGAQDAPFTSSEATCFTDAAWGEWHIVDTEEHLLKDTIHLTSL